MHGSLFIHVKNCHIDPPPYIWRSIYFPRFTKLLTFFSVKTYIPTSVEVLIHAIHAFFQNLRIGSTDFSILKGYELWMDDGLGGENPHGLLMKNAMAMWKMMCITEMICFFFKMAADFLVEIWRVWHLPWMKTLEHSTCDMWSTFVQLPVFRLNQPVTYQWSQESSAEAMMATTSRLRPTSWPLAWCWAPQSTEFGCHLHPIFESHRSKSWVPLYVSNLVHAIPIVFPSCSNEMWLGFPRSSG